MVCLCFGVGFYRASVCNTDSYLAQRIQTTISGGVRFILIN